MKKFKYILRKLNNDVYFKVTHQDESLRYPFKDLKGYFIYKTSNGWSIYSDSCSEVVLYCKYIYIRGRDYSVDDKPHYFPVEYYDEVKQALEEFSRYVNKDVIILKDDLFKI